jgi:TfoX/Sxy family transcriptional regulator of competence genes
MKMSWRKSPDALVARFSEIVPSDPRVERRQMFGYPAAFVGGNMFMGLHQENLILRLPEQHRSEFHSIRGASVFEPMPGRPMREYVVVPEAMLSNSSALRVWTGRSLEYAASLPSKKAKSPAKKVKAPPARKSARRRA